MTPLISRTTFHVFCRCCDRLSRVDHPRLSPTRRRRRSTHPNRCEDALRPTAGRAAVDLYTLTNAHGLEAKS